MMQDPVVSVKDAVAWTLGRVCEFLSPCIQPKAHLSDLVSSLLCGLQDNLRIVANCCWALMNLAEQLAPLPSFRNPTSTMSIYFEGIATSLLQFTDNNCNEANCRTSAYEALSAFIMYSANDCIPMVQNIVLAILDRLESTTAMEVSRQRWCMERRRDDF
jgi:importin subunit beta-1